MNELNGILLLNYEIDPQTGEIRITGSRRPDSGGRPPAGPPPEQPGCGAAAIGAFITLFTCLIFDMNFGLALIIAFIAAMIIFNSKKNS